MSTVQVNMATIGFVSSESDGVVIHVVSQGPQGPQGPQGTTDLAGHLVSAPSLQIGDHLEFAGDNWVNVPKTTLSDGGNF